MYYPPGSKSEALRLGNPPPQQKYVVPILFAKIARPKKKLKNTNQLQGTFLLHKFEGSHFLQNCVSTEMCQRPPALFCNFLQTNEEGTFLLHIFDYKVQIDVDDVHKKKPLFSGS